jgi:tetratricopeptide (TPR) repeat protein
MAKKKAERGKEAPSMCEGDVFYELIDGKYHAYQVLKVDDFGEHGQIHHLKMYKPLDKEPVESDIDTFEVFVWHAPFEPQKGSKYLGHRDIKAEDLEGFHTYLKMTDFNRYLKETGLDVNAIIDKAQEFYNTGNQSADAKEYEDAIKWYDMAIDEFPYFYEAIDNKAFTLMDLGRWKAAIACFEESLRVEPKNVAAVFSIGECLYKLGEYEGAVAQFQAALVIQPDHEPSKEWLERARNAMGRS